MSDSLSAKSSFILHTFVIQIMNSQIIVKFFLTVLKVKAMNTTLKNLTSFERNLSSIPHHHLGAFYIH